ncbi:MAG TPA: hypothetical protein VGF94_29580 [Kofleriaceae bacterium]
MHALLLERRLLARALGCLRRLDAQACFALRAEPRLFDRPLVIALGLDARFFFRAPPALVFLLSPDARLVGLADRALFFLDAVLLDLAELAKGEQH